MVAARRPSQRLTLLILVLASITVITLDYRGAAQHDIDGLRNSARDVFAPVQSAIASVLHPLGDVVAGAFDYGSVQHENEQLQLANGTLRREVAENAGAARQLQQVLSLAHLPFVGNIPTVTSAVVAGATSNFELTVEIDRGTSEGVGVGMPVVGGAGLIGTVIAAGSSTAVVRLINDPRSTVAVSLGPDGPVAVADGRGSGSPLALSDVTASMGARPGETVYTSSIGAAYPSGIPVGTVEHVRSTGSPLSEQVLVKPLGGLNGLDYVSVLQWLPTA